MKILHIADLCVKSGGPANVVFGLTEGLLEKGIDVTIYGTSNKSREQNSYELKQQNLRFFPVGFLSKIWASHSSLLASAITQSVNDFDIVHIHEIWHYPLFTAYQSIKRTRKPFIVTVHGSLEPWCLNFKPLKKSIYSLFFQRRILQNASVIHALTEAEQKDIRAYGITGDVRVIPNGINPEEFQNLPFPDEIEKVYPMLKGKKVILFLGRIHPKKGLDVLVKTFSDIAKTREDIILVLAGNDSDGYQGHIENMLKRENVLNRVIFTGLVTGRRKYEILSRADLFVLPSYSEGFSMAILEAMTCGLPVIITNKCNFPEVGEAQAGEVIEPVVDQLTQSLLKLLSNSQLCEEMGRNGRNLIFKKFTWDKIADQMISLYREILEKHKQVSYGRIYHRSEIR